MTKVFLDTNILIYAVDQRDPAKHERAIEAVEKQIRDGSGVISTQVLQEFASVALTKLHQDLDTILAELSVLEVMEVVQISPTLVRRALELHGLHRINFWDAAILAAAEACALHAVMVRGFRARLDLRPHSRGKPAGGVTALYVPPSPAARMRHFKVWPRLAGEELEGQADGFADENVGGGQGGLADFCQLAVLVAVEFERPGFAVDDEQFDHPDTAVEGDFVAGALAGVDDFDQEIGRPAPVRAAVDGLRLAKENRHVGLAVILLPPRFPVAEVHAGKYLAHSGTTARLLPKWTRIQIPSS